jgi:hypothetical protein
MIASQVDISRALAIGGWMSEKELTWLASSAKDCKTIVEFGSFHGRSTRALADNTDGVVYAVDPWNGFYPQEDGSDFKVVNTFVLPIFRKNLADHIATGRVIPVRKFSTSFTLPFKVDMVFIDGDHTYRYFVRDIDKAISLLKPGGILCGHDYGHSTWDGVKKAVDERFPSVKIEDTIWWTREF